MTRSRKALCATLVATTSLAMSGCGMLRSKVDKKSNGGGKSSPAAIDTASDTSTATDPSIGKVTPQPSPLGLTGGLRTFSSCAEVEGHIEAQMIAAMQREIRQQIEWAEQNHAEPLGGIMKADTAAPAADTASVNAGGSEESATSEKSAPDEVTTTNDQVEGVEEADFVKNTGTHVFHVTHGKLRILKSWPAEQMGLLSETALDGLPFELLFDEDKSRLVVLSHPVYEPTEEDLAGGGAIASGAAPVMDGVADVPGPAWDYGMLDVTVVDVADPAAPATVGKYRLKGDYHASRRIGSSVRIVLQSYRYWPSEVVTYLDSSADYDQAGNYVPRPKAERIAALEALMAKNEEIIKSKDLAWWLETGRYVKLDDNGAAAPVLDLGDCRQIHAPTVDAEFGLTRVASLDLDAATLSETLLLAQVGEIYASTSSLYLTTPYYWWDDENRDTDYTYVHKFDISAAGPAAYRGSGGVEGSVINQFAMDEYDGHLRLATTVQRYCRGESGGATAVVSAVGAASLQGDAQACPPMDERLFNQVSVLAEDDGKLTQVGVTGALAANERIYSVRFDGSRGFMVTFRQVDPLFTLDLSDHAHPAVVGELKVPGFSSYIHMIDDQHLLTIGRDATETGQVRGLKLAIFDVSSMAEPKELQTLTLEGELWSEAEYNHKAFNFFGSKSLLAIPVTGYRATTGGAASSWWGGYYSALKVFKIDAAAGIEEVGEVDMSDVYAGSGRRDEAWWFSGATVQRSIFADDYVYAISDLGIKAAKSDQLTAPVSTVRYECDATCYWQWWWW